MMECRTKLCDDDVDGGVSLTRACVSACVPVMFYLYFDFFSSLQSRSSINYSNYLHHNESKSMEKPNGRCAADIYKCTGNGVCR